MKRLSQRFSLAARLWVAGGLVLLAFVTMAATALWGLTAAQRSLNFVHDNALQPLVRIAGVQTQTHLAIAEMLRAIQHAPASFTAPLHDHPVSQHLKALAGQRERSEALWREYLATELDADERAMAESTAQALQRWYAKVDAAVTAIERDEYTPQAVSAFLFASRTEARAVQESLEALKLYQTSLGQREAAAAGARQGAALTLLAGCVLLLALPAVLLGAGALRRQSCGFATALAAAHAVAGGDLVHRVDDEGATDEVGQLLRSVGVMQQRLREVVGEVRANAERVATASTQIAQGNMDLSGRTEQQASALQQTAATMEELGSTVRHNADHTRLANELARGVSEAALRGGAVMDEVVGTMRGIDDSGRRIAEIIGVIDGIAFQTNILALNAAVEAARAGEQGRGFAVVAGEVRSLAQRSAAAAKEIKGLIGTSVERVQQGVTQVDRAGATMQEIVDSVRRVTDLMGEIAHASQEQSGGVAQVGQAVAEMDRVTQQNAALVEQSAAAAQSLSEQARRLVELMAVFRVGPQARPA